MNIDDFDDRFLTDYQIQQMYEMEILRNDFFDWERYIPADNIPADGKIIDENNIKKIDNK